MKNLPRLLPLLIALAVPFTAQGAISLTGTIRDFVIDQPGVPPPLGYAGHPDFEATIGGLNTGMVASTLSGGVPVYIGTAPYGSVSSASSFSQWYKDVPPVNNVPGINMSETYSISLVEGPPGVFVYSDLSFFPIDGKLLGDQGLGHNYHFTYHIHSTFTYAANQSFQFSGDDDVWVFFNGELAVDIGGIHQQSESGIVNLNTLGFNVGDQVVFDFFFAERHTTESRFTITTSIPFAPPGTNPDPNVVPEPVSLAFWSVMCAALGGASLRRRRLLV